MACFIPAIILGGAALKREVLLEYFQVKQSVPTVGYMDSFRSLGGKIVIRSPVTGVVANTALTAGTALIAWKLWDLGAVDVAARAVAMVVPGVRYAWRKMLGPRVRYDASKCTGNNVLESRKPGSEESDMTIPSCQVRVGYMRDGDLFIIGCAIRFAENALIGPDHVLGGSSDVIKYAVGTQGMLPLGGKERVPLDTDLVAIFLTNADFSRLGAGVCEIKPVPDSGTFAQIVGPESKGTTGRIISDSVVFGRVIYGGTTLHGYSGAAYAAGKGLLGIHQMGGAQNSGVSASYVWCLLRVYLKQRLEDSEDWLFGQYQSGRRLRWTRSHDPQEVQICIDGAYTMVNVDSMYKAFGKDWVNSETIDRASYKPRFEDFESVPMPTTMFPAGEDNGSKSGGSSGVDNTPVSVVLKVPDLTDAYRMLSSRQQKDFRRSLGLLPKPTPATSGQAGGAK